MGGLTGAVHWWEESQLRVLVLTSMAVQLFLLSFPFLRRKAIPGWFRFIMWLAYHGGDAVAIYGLAMLFNRHMDQGDGVGGDSSNDKLLEVVWAPVLLIHLGGSDAVTAYNIEDNELWTRHLLTTVSQVIVAVYVFSKSWPPGGDKRLLQTAILLFGVGIVRCFMKPWAFKRASIYNLVSSAATTKQMKSGNMCNKLEDYVKLAKDVVAKYTWSCLDDRQFVEERGEASKLFVDLSSPYTLRISIFEKFWVRSEERTYFRQKKERTYFAVYDSVQRGLATAFFLLYTKLQTSLPEEEVYPYRGLWDEKSRFLIHILLMCLPMLSVPLFHRSHREAYNATDVKITYAILCCTTVLELFSAASVAVKMEETEYPGPATGGVWPQTVAQYSIAGYYVRNKKHNVQMKIANLVGCKDFLDQHWCMEPCFSSARITHLVLGYLKEGWKQKIQDAASYRSFNNHSSHWGLNMNTPFDECVLLWHLTTDFCFFSTSFPDHRCTIAEDPELGAEIMVPAGKCSQESADCKAVQCRHMSNYMVYLLFVNPEMLLPGSRRNLFKMAYDELKDILRVWDWNPVCTASGVKLIKEEATVMGRLIRVMKNKTGKRASQEESLNEAIVRDTAITVTQEKSERSSQEESSMEGSNRDENFIHQSWALAERLLKMDEMKMWEEIQDVWVQMLCFSASRCRGYLHAKALGKGGEFLSYVWLLLFYMGMETFSDRLQRELFPIYQGDFHNGTAPPLTSKVSTTSISAPSGSVVQTRATSSASMVRTHASISAGTTASTSEICMSEE